MESPQNLCCGYGMMSTPTEAEERDLLEKARAGKTEALDRLLTPLGPCFPKSVVRELLVGMNRFR